MKLEDFFAEPFLKIIESETTYLDIVNIQTKEKLKAMKIATNDPAKLIEDIKEKIDHKKITSWEFENNILTHKGEQYIDHIYFSYAIIDDKSIIKFEMHSDGDSYAILRGPQLLESMLIRHFNNRVEIIK